MLTCKQLAQLHASDYLDGNLTGWQRTRVRVHLAICAHCRCFMRQMKQASNILSGRPIPVDGAQTSDLVKQLMQASRETAAKVEGKDPPA